MIERNYKHYANGMTSNFLNKADAELILKNLDVENWLANMMFKYFGGYYSTSNTADTLITDMTAVKELINESNIEEAQTKLNNFSNFFKFFHEGIDDIDLFDYSKYEASKNLATEKQINYINYLLNKSGKTADLTNLTKAEAGKMIDELKMEKSNGKES